MSTERGFVYAIASESMPNLIKIGRTARSPHARAADLSAVTGVPLSLVDVFGVAHDRGRA